jgi:vitamin K-dependent gamma-carboxylase
MMVHSWDTNLVVVKVVDNNSGGEYFLDPEAWTQNERWTKHADMCVQYAQCLKRNLMLDLERKEILIYQKCCLNFQKKSIESGTM